MAPAHPLLPLDVRFLRVKRVKFAEKHLLCLPKGFKNGTKEARLILLLSREYISIFLEKNGSITVHFRSKKVGT